MAEMKKAMGLLFLIGLILVSMRIWGVKESLDARFSYSSEEASQFLTGLSPDQNSAYVRNQFLDFGLIVAYSSLFWLLSERFFPHSKLLQGSSFVPGFFDLIETTLILHYLSTGNALFGFFDFGILTTLKWTTGSLFLIALLIKALARKVRAEP